MADKYADFGHLTVEVSDGIGIVRFAPTIEEDFEYSFFTDVRDVFTPLSRDPGVGAVLLTGSAPDRFAEPPPGVASLIRSKSLEERAGRFLTIQQILTNILTFRKPLVAGVNGRAGGIGAQIALLCDAAVASESVVFHDPHVEFGIAAGDGGTAMWPLLVGPGLARQILLEGRHLTAPEALGLGLISKVVPQDQVFDAALEVAQRVRDLPRVAFMSTKLAMNNWFRLATLLCSDLTAAYEAAGVAESEFVDRRH